ncbi:MAG: transposase [Candidatus Competibacteraceae bacterium]|nr:transposase [Candidatus Competibacteraceae bacterium]
MVYDRQHSVFKQNLYPCNSQRAKKETRVDDYLKHLQQDSSALPAGVRDVLADGYYSKIKLINGVCNLGLHLVSTLRHDANRRWLYHGPQKTRGRPKQYDGKVRFQLQEWDRFEKAGQVNETQVDTSIVNSAHFKRNVRIIYLMKPIGQKIQTALLSSTDIELPALEIYRLYQARFQIEFLFRDAKPFTGLLDSQAHCPSALHFHFNASMTALNLLKLEDRQRTEGTDRSVISIASWKIRKFKSTWIITLSRIPRVTFGLNPRRVVEATRTWTFSPLLQPTGFQPVVVEIIITILGTPKEPV